MKICIGTTCSKDADWMFMAANCLDSIKKYCDMWGFDSSYDIGSFDGFHPVWNKYFFILQNLEKYDYVLYLDSDAKVNNFDFSLEKLIQDNPNKDIFLSRDLSGVCSGVLLVKNSAFSKKLFNTLFEYKELRNVVPGEQDALIRYINNNLTECINKIKFVNPSVFHLTTWGDTNLNNFYWKNSKYEPFIFHALGNTYFAKQQIFNYPTIHGDRNSFKYFFNRPVIGAEIGVSVAEHAAASLSQIEGTLYLIDDWAQSLNRKDITNRQQNIRDKEYNFVKTLFQDKPNIHIIRQPSVQSSKEFPDGFFDYVYIDAYHQYDAVKSDLDSWWPKVKKGGLLCGHDYINNEDSTTLIETKRALDDFVYKHFPVRGFVSSEPSFKSWYIYK